MEKVETFSPKTVYPLTDISHKKNTQPAKARITANKMLCCFLCITQKEQNKLKSSKYIPDNFVYQVLSYNIPCPIYMTIDERKREMNVCLIISTISVYLVVKFYELAQFHIPFIRCKLTYA